MPHDFCLLSARVVDGLHPVDALETLR
jgi:hypothetical protein